MESRITYITATYNRAHLLPNLYNSLLRQTNNKFIWFIVDDGSTDDTKKLVDKWIEEDKITIKYYGKENGGKNTAIDYANKHCETEFLCYVDSDDYLSDDATEILYSYFDRIQDDGVVGLVGRRANYDGTPFAGQWCKNSELTCFYDIPSQFGYSADTILVFKTAIIKQFSFPVISDERFVTESVLYQQFLYDYKILMITELIYLAEYQEVGYTSQGNDLFLKNPKGFLYSLWVDAYFSINRKGTLKKTLTKLASYYAWKSVIKVEEPKSDFKINWIYRLLGKILKLKLVFKFKKQYEDFIQRRNNKK